MKQKRQRMPSMAPVRSVKIDRKTRKLFRKRAREYNSDDDNDEQSAPSNAVPRDKDELDGPSSSEDGDDEKDVYRESEDFEGEDEDIIQPGITKLTEGCRAFKLAFKNIVKKSIADDSLGPVLSGHKKLIIEKLAEEEDERKGKGEAKKEKHLVGERGHLKPASYLDSHEKFLIGVATKGVVKLFNAVNKAQNAQKGLDPSRSKDAKVIRKRRKEAFFSELGKTSTSAADVPTKDHSSLGAIDGEGPAWAPLRDNYMLTSSKLKSWDKVPESTAADEIGLAMEYNGSSDDDD